MSSGLGQLDQMWISTMRQISSAITGSGQENQSQIGKPLGETGSGALTLYGLEERHAVIPQPWLRPIVDEQLSCLVSLVNMKKPLPNSLTYEEAKQSLTLALAQVRQAFEPASPQEITSSLEVVAEVFRAPLPERQAFKLYVAVFQDIPGIAFKEACRQIVKTHRYPNLPLPAEFIEASKPTVEHLKAWRSRLELAVSRL